MMGPEFVVKLQFKIEQRYHWKCVFYCLGTLLEDDIEPDRPVRIGLETLQEAHDLLLILLEPFGRERNEEGIRSWPQEIVEAHHCTHFSGGQSWLEF